MKNTTIDNRPGRFLLKPSAIRSKFIISALTWVNLLLVTFAIFSELTGETAVRWLFVMSFLNTVAVGLAYREILRLIVHQETEILAASKLQASLHAPAAERASPAARDSVIPIRPQASFRN